MIYTYFPPFLRTDLQPSHSFLTLLRTFIPRTCCLDSDFEPLIRRFARASVTEEFRDCRRALVGVEVAQARCCWKVRDAKLVVEGRWRTKRVRLRACLPARAGMESMVVILMYRAISLETSMSW